MAYQKQYKLNKSFILTLVFLSLIISTLFWPVSNWIRLLSVLAMLFIFIFIRRSYIYFMNGAKIIKTRGACDQAFNNFEKALKTGISADYQNSIGILFIQNGRQKRGCQILEKVVETQRGNDKGNLAISALSMGYYADGRLKDAISLLEGLKETGSKDHNMYINLINYQLMDGNLDRVKTLLSEAKELKIDVPGMKDNIGCYNIMKGNWNKADSVYKELVRSNPSFPDACIHASQVDVHFNRWEDAIEKIDNALSLRFSFAGCYTRDYAEELKVLYQNANTREEITESMEENRILVASGREFGKYCKGC